MIKWITKKLGYIPHSELKFHCCKCYSNNSTLNMDSRYYYDITMKKIDDLLLALNRSDPKKGVKRGKRKKAS